MRGRTDTNSEVDGEMDSALTDALREAPDLPAQARIAKARWFGVGCMILGVFCGVISVAPLPSRQISEIAMWIAFGVCLLGVGAFFIDRASRDERRSTALLRDGQGQSRRESGFRPRAVK